MGIRFADRAVIVFIAYCILCGYTNSRYCLNNQVILLEKFLSDARNGNTFSIPNELLLPEHSLQIFSSSANYLNDTSTTVRNNLYSLVSQISISSEDLQVPQKGAQILIGALRSENVNNLNSLFEFLCQLYQKFSDGTKRHSPRFI